MKKAVGYAAVALLITAAVAHGGSTTKNDSNLSPLAWMTQGTWTANVKSPAGKTTLIESRLSWAATGTAILFNTRFNNAPQYFGFYAYDQSRKQIRFFYSSAQGDLTEGFVSERPDGFDQDFTVVDEKGTTRYHATVIRDGADAYDFNVYAAGSGVPVVTVRYERK